MSDLKKLAKRLMTLDDRIIACMKCGMCQAVCPMFGATMMEADVARGKLALVDNLGKVSWSYTAPNGLALTTRPWPTSWAAACCAAPVRPTAPPV